MIPRILHFCFGFTPNFGGKPWSLVHHVCVKNAIAQLRPTDVRLYYEYEPSGPWWDVTSRLVTAIPIKTPSEVFGNALVHPAHRADVVRLQKLMEVGGIYLDADVFVHRDFTPILGNSTVLGQQGDSGLANAVILAEPSAPFLTHWYNTYRTFRSKGRDEYWDEHSVKIPGLLAKRYPTEVTVLSPDAFFWPLWNRRNLRLIFRSQVPLVSAQTLATHLWETHAWNRYLEHLTPGDLRRQSSNFSAWALPLLSDLPDDYGALRSAERWAFRRQIPHRLIAASGAKIQRAGRILVRGRPNAALPGD